MSDDMQGQFDRYTERVEAPPPDYESVLEGGRRRLWRKRASAVLVGGAFAIAGWGLLLFLPGAARVESPEAIGPRAQAETVPFSRVATFAVRAVAQANLLNLVGNFSDYKGVESTQEGWKVTFDAFVCKAASCASNPGGNSQLTVEVEGNTLAVTEATGPVAGDSLESLLRYEEEVTSEEVGLQFPFVELRPSPDEGVSVLASPLWTGPIPASDVEVKCLLTVRDSESAVIFERTLNEPLPQSEEMRAGTKFIFGIPGNFAQEASEADLECTSKR